MRAATLTLLLLLPGGPLHVGSRIITLSPGQALPRGQVVDPVACVADPSQSYALFLPSQYRPDRQWPLLMGFHPGARGRAIVDLYQQVADDYGYIVVASNNSRNGPWAVSMAAVQALTKDVSARFAIDPKRLYLTGHSGGARVAMAVALANSNIAGVIASSAGFPDSQPRAKVPFLVFGTAGTEDFNYSEVRSVARALTTPHRVAIFEGGHTLPPPAVAREAIEWMELRAMVAQTRPRDVVLIERLFAQRMSVVDTATSRAFQAQALDAIAADFAPLRDVGALTARASALRTDKAVVKALAQEKADERAEAQLLNELIEREAGLADERTHTASLLRLRSLIAQLHRHATASTDSQERQRARRVLRAVMSGSAERVVDPEYAKILQQYRLPRT
jgi:predicted esterase